MKLDFSVELINKVLAYMEKQPYGEVATLIAALHAEAAEAQKQPVPQIVDPKDITEVTSN